MGDWNVNILGSNGLRLTQGTHFHLDEGPDYAYLSIYRATADACQIDIVRNREPVISADGADAVVQWQPCANHNAHLEVRYRTIEDQLAIEMAIKVETLQSYQTYELFVSSYFTPYHTPRFALQDTSVDPTISLRWYETTWCGPHNDEAWPRDAAARQVFLDGHWLTEPALNWTLGANYALPLMTQQHRFGPSMSIISMARRNDCIGLSGYNGFHNSQYFHLFGRDTNPGDILETTVRMEIVEASDDKLNELAVERYQAWDA
jgi:hypothetical protein